MTEIKEIESIVFGIYSTQEILNMSVCEVNNTKLSGEGSVYDNRMGPNIGNKQSCGSCKGNNIDCPGHFGHIKLEESIIHPLFYKFVVSFLRCYCINCSRLLILKEQIALSELSKYKKERKFEKILEKLEKIDLCCHCSHPQPKVIYSPLESSISMIYKEKIMTEEGKKVDNKISIVMTVDEIKKIFDNISDEDVKLCGFNPKNVHPRNLILAMLLVIPPCARPYVIADGNICDDDLTNQYIEIIKSNNTLAPKNNNKQLFVSEDDEKQLQNQIKLAFAKKQKASQSLKFRILTLFNNSQGKAKHPTNGRPIKGIKERLTGKEGHLRSNLMGKRVNFSGRTVIGGDPNLKFGEMGIPEKIAKNLTFPKIVTKFNIDQLTTIVNNGKANFYFTNKKCKEEANCEKCKNDKLCTKRINLKYGRLKKGTQLLYNDIVIRNKKEMRVINGNVELQDGDQIKRQGVLLKKVKYPKKK